MEDNGREETQRFMSHQDIAGGASDSSAHKQKRNLKYTLQINIRSECACAFIVLSQEHTAVLSINHDQNEIIALKLALKLE